MKKIRVKYFEPCELKVNGDNVEFYLNPQSIIIEKDGQQYESVLTTNSGKIGYNKKTKLITNADIPMRFKNKNHEFDIVLLIFSIESDLSHHLYDFVKNNSSRSNLNSNVNSNEIEELVALLELSNIERLIDRALINKNRQEFYRLMELKEKLKVKHIV